LYKGFNSSEKYNMLMKINEIFFSLQGEGLLVGTPTIFVRTTGCNLRCTYCDTQYAYEKGTEMPLQKILNKIRIYPCSDVCITGGEPLMQKETPVLIDELLRRDYRVCLETNGSYRIHPLIGRKSLVVSLDVKCPSSGSNEQMVLENIGFLRKKDQLKFIIKDKNDYEYTKKILSHYSPICTVFFQPVWGTDPKRLVSWVLNDGLSVRLSLQLHKLIWGTKRGV